MTDLNHNGAYAVTVGPDINDEPVVWLFAEEVDADAFAEAYGPGASVTYEPIAATLDDEDLYFAHPEVVKEARRALRADA